VSQLTDRLFFRLALIGALAAAFTLGACGRKGALDPPPSAVSASGQQAPANTSLIGTPAAKGAATKSTAAKPGAKPQSTAGKAPDNSFILDPLLN
jgi:predicted small lipoprotein YifL